MVASFKGQTNGKRHFFLFEEEEHEMLSWSLDDVNDVNPFPYTYNNEKRYSLWEKTLQVSDQRKTLDETPTSCIV